MSWRGMPVRGAATVGAALVLAGCFTSTADFADDAEEFIAETVAEAVGTEFVTVECDEPDDQEVGTRFSCTAIDVDGGTWVFDNEITDDNEFTVNEDRRP